MSKANVRRITVGIPSYNERQNISNLLQAIEEQHTQIFEVLISDDSSDNTPSLVRNFALHTRCLTSNFSTMIQEEVHSRME